MLVLRHQLYDYLSPIVMGILNITPDSFALHCEGLDAESVESACKRLSDAGADWLDIGACSTRPGSEPVSEEEERRRLDIALPVVKRMYPEAIVSVDTFRSGVAQYVVETYEVDIINDVSGLRDEKMADIVARARVPYIYTYPGGEAEEMLAFFAAGLNRLHRAGVKDVILDPGLGFGKTLEQNYACLKQLPQIKVLNCPVMVGLSRKSMICQVLECTPQQALNGTTAAHILALNGGADILRVHDVKEAKEAIRIWKKSFN